ncbi:MAG: 30S ribosomal protein S10 [Candidatus Heimdallarchaeota archaeon]|nr:30S ribosomal protein S10 [Candidatus Heimdallarchaeota archaeon]RLI73349.1 MAG: 30S ribosomal protein S10 [Candidatus Heimdallarchaeota archaeon]
MSAQRARIRLSGQNIEALTEVCNQITKIAEKTGVRMAGPIPLPTKIITIPVRKSPCGNGTQTFEHHEMRIHKRLIDIDQEERTLKQILRVKIPEDIHVEIKLS